MPPDHVHAPALFSRLRSRSCQSGLELSALLRLRKRDLLQEAGGSAG
jgi:hypothetical protein